MTSRILILDASGVALYGLTSPSQREAAEWADSVVAGLAAHGIDAIALELQPTEGGDACRRGVLGQLHRLRAELRQLPAGRREVLGLNLYAEGDAGAHATLGAGRGMPKAQAASTPMPVRGRLRVIAAPAHVTNPRERVMVRRGRANAEPGQPRTIEEHRHARRVARAAARRAP